MSTSALENVRCLACKEAADPLRHSCRRQPLCGAEPWHVALRTSAGDFESFRTQACDVALAQTSPMHLSRYEAHFKHEEVKKSVAASAFTDMTAHVTPTDDFIKKKPYSYFCQEICTRSTDDGLVLLRMQERLVDELANIVKSMVSDKECTYQRLPRSEVMFKFELVLLTNGNRLVVFQGQLVLCSAQSGPNLARQVFLRFELTGASDADGDVSYQRRYAHPAEIEYDSRSEWIDPRLTPEDPTPPYHPLPLPRPSTPPHHRLGNPFTPPPHPPTPVGGARGIHPGWVPRPHSLIPSSAHPPLFRPHPPHVYGACGSSYVSL